LLSGAAVTASSGAHAQITAKQPLRILVPIPAGGTSDVVARLIAERLKDSTAQPVVVENRPGATGRVAVDALRSAAPDGTTILLAPIVVPVIGPLVFKNLNYDPVKDFAPVSQVSKYELAFAVAPNHPARTVPEFVAWASATPARVNVGNPGAGGLPHFVGVMIGRAAGIEFEHIAYKGAGLLQTELMSGQVAAGTNVLSDWIALHRAGKLRILATSGAGRSRFLPEVPTFREQGYPAVEAVGWHGVYAPAGTPRPVVDRLSMAIVKALQAPELREKLLNLGIEPTGTTPEALAAIMAADTARWGPVIKASGFSVE
jgi:tripartite-type tricarboxylate transporter receptor subunit TctC